VYPFSSQNRIVIVARLLANDDSKHLVRAEALGSFARKTFAQERADVGRKK